MRKRKLIPLLIAVALFATLGVMLYLRANAPPEAARLLPESDAIVYIHLKTMRTATHFDQSPIARSLELQHFIDTTGIVPERDIDSAAFALHKVTALASKTTVLPSDLFVSEVFIGHFDNQRLEKYLAGIAASREVYSGRSIYTIPMDGQTLRVAVLNYDSIAASNMPTAEQIHSILDRSRASALATPGSSLLAARFHDVPLLAEAWGIGHIGLPFSQNGEVSVLGLQLPIPAESDLVASLRYSPTVHMLSGGAVQLRIEEFAPDAATAQATVDTLNAILGLLRGIGPAIPTHNTGDAALRDVLASTQLERHNQRALLDATATLDQLKTIFNAHDPASAAGDASPTPVAASK